MDCSIPMPLQTLSPKTGLKFKNMEERRDVDSFDPLSTPKSFEGTHNTGRKGGKHKKPEKKWVKS